MEIENLDKYSGYAKTYQLDASKKACMNIDSRSKKQCLINIPTGAGKTGVMAMISSVLSTAY